MTFFLQNCITDSQIANLQTRRNMDVLDGKNYCISWLERSLGMVSLASLSASSPEKRLAAFDY